jgi:deoxyadenosine/deoxycytidine kinase
MLEHVQPPDLLVYLDCTVDTAMSRIKKRDRGLESGIPRDYLERLNRRYLSFYDAYDASPKIFIDTDERPIDVSANLPPILAEIRSVLEAG